MWLAQVLGAGIAGVLAMGLAHPVQASTPPETWLFVAQSAEARTTPMSSTASGHERFRLTLRNPTPVTKFADRPFRDAQLISPKALAQHWQAWFAESAPNAVLTFSPPDTAPVSIVTELSRPRWDAESRSLSFTAVRSASRHEPTRAGANWSRVATPRTARGVSLFIDDASDCDLTAVPVSCPWADLSNMDLSGANLAGADLRGSDFTATDLSGADLSNAVFSDSTQYGANLSEANLRGANITGVWLLGMWTDEWTTCWNGNGGPCPGTNFW